MAKPSIETLRKRIAATQAEIEDLRLDRLTRDETEERLMAFVDEQAAQFSVETFVAQATRGNRRLRDDAFEIHVRGVPGASEAFGSIAPWICWSAKDQVKQHFRNMLDAVSPDACSDVPREERAQQLEAKIEELDRLEVEEERLISESEQTATPIPRRPDCRPEIVLYA